MSINDRVREVRNALNLTQKDFGQRLAIAQSYLTNIETGKREVTEKIQKLVCLQFNVNEEWLRTGEGEMFVEDDNVLLSQLSKQYDLDAFGRKFIETFISLPQSHRDVIKGFALSLVEEASAPAAPEVTIGGSRIDDPEIAAELSVLARELEEEKNGAEGSSALTSAKDA
jgi:transcriptional regulator with XRE-family HTH domain